MQAYEIASLIIIGFFLGKLDTGTFQKVKKYFGSPIDQRLEFDWAMYKLLGLFSKVMSERFYEASQHCYQNRFISILCGFGLIDIVRYEFATEYDDRVAYRVKYYQGFRSYKQLKQMALEQIQIVQKETDRATGFYALFICGHNIVFDYWNSMES